MKIPFIIEQSDIELLNTTANIIYDLSFEHASRHCISIKMNILENQNDIIIVKSPVWIPGSYKVRDMNSNQHDIHIHDINGNLLSWKWLSKSAIEILNPDKIDIVISYEYFANDRGVRTSHVNRNHAFIMPVACLMYVEDRMEEIHHVAIHTHDSWKTITTALSPIDEHTTGDIILYGTLNYHILIDSPIEIGNHECISFDVAGALHEIAVITQESIDIEWLKGEIKRAVEIEYAFWGDLPYDRYVFFLLIGEGLRGGLEHLRCNVSAVEPSAFQDKTNAQGMMALLVHEFFHTWNVKRIRPIELGPFNYEKENYTHMLWLAEGFTSYYDDLLSFRSGFYTIEEYLSVLAQSHLGKLARVPGRFSMSLKDSSFLAWTKLYAMSPDQQNQFPSYYTKGGIVALLLDLLIIIKSSGTSKLDLALKAMWESYKLDGKNGFTEDQIINLIEDICGVAIRTEFTDWLNGTKELPYQALFTEVGLEWKEEVAVIRQDLYGDSRPFHPKKQSIFFGCSVAEDHGRMFVKEVEKDSPADKAGIAIDDEIISVNGKRITNRSMLVRALESNGLDQETDILANCDGKIYETKVQLQSAISYSLKVSESLTHKQESLLKFWLHG